MSKKLLVVIDYQNDFVTGCLGGAAAVALADGIAARVKAALSEGGYVLFTRDTHDDDYLTTREGTFLPVPHCMQGSEGWHLYGALSQYEDDASLDADEARRVAVVNKPTFGSNALPAAVHTLCGGAPDSIELCGVVTDICVISNAIVLHTFFLDADIAVNGALCAAATQEGHTRALDVLAGMGYRILS